MLLSANATVGSSRMNTKQAKDFLAQQAAEQAALDDTSLSDTERRMMYFTESDPTSCDDPLSLNDEFEAHDDTAQYEAKMSVLLQHAYQRLKAENPEGKRTWDQAVRELRKGDHYFLVLWDIKPTTKPQKGDSLKLLGVALLIVAGFVVAILLASKYNIDVDSYSRKYGWIVFVGLFLLVSGTLRTIYRALVVWFNRLARKDE
jgi:hypothetical protein